MEKQDNKPFGVDFWLFVISRSYMIIHILSWFIFAVSLFHFITVYGKLPDECGVHFDSNGEIDVYASKMLGFVPFLVTFVALIIAFVFERLAGNEKVKMGLKMSQKGETLFRGTIVMGLALEGFLIAIIFSYYWERSVAIQQALPMDQLRGVVIAAILGVPITAVILLITIAVIYKEKADKK